MRVFLQTENFLKGNWNMSAKSVDKHTRKMRMAAIRKDFLALHPGNECVIQVNPPHGISLQGLPRIGWTASKSGSYNGVTEDWLQNIMFMSFSVCCLHCSS